ncbi:hypothetical protein, partial [Klebsiella pneumoniae]|uniref:hypothetical protein n=1 Tax=Klebsiella pneumoniae TaxID=573 RepID=UPI001C705BE0
HHLEMVFVWKQNYILVDEYFFFCCTWIVNSAGKCSRRARRSVRSRATSFVRAGLRPFVSIIATKL